MQFKSTRDIFVSPDKDEVFDINWMDSNKVIVPSTTPWDYAREMKIEDVEIWEVLVGGFNNCGVYAAWKPYAEFYLVARLDPPMVETFYGPGAQKRLKQYMTNNNIPFYTNEIWVEPEDMWLYDESHRTQQSYII